MWCVWCVNVWTMSWCHFKFESIFCLFVWVSLCFRFEWQRWPRKWVEAFTVLASDSKKIINCLLQRNSWHSEDGLGANPAKSVAMLAHVACKWRTRRWYKKGPWIWSRYDEQCGKTGVHSDSPLESLALASVKTCTRFAWPPLRLSSNSMSKKICNLFLKVLTTI